MLNNKSINPTLPAVDIKRARKFYEEKLGLELIMEDPSPGLWFKAGNGTMLYIYQRAATRADHTVAAFEVDNIDAEVSQLKGKGVRFEEYDIPNMGIKTVNGIAAMPLEGNQMKTAWFKDSEGNILALNQMPVSMKEKMRSRLAASPAE
jgi:catechol 2,3-dioxygenase-like lactoylglutathione lyase family enzyme